MSSTRREAAHEPVPSNDAQPARVSESAERTTASLGLWPWAQLAARNGMALEQFCELADVQVSALRDPEHRFSQSEANRIAALAFERFGPSAAMEAALTIEPGHFNLLEVIARSAPTVGAGMEQGCRFFALLHDGGRLAFEPGADGSIGLRWYPPASYPVHHGYLELTFAVAMHGIRRETGSTALAPSLIQFRHPPPADISRHVQVLGAAPEFGADVDRLVLDAAAAALPLTRDNPNVHSAAVETGSELIED